MALYIIGQILPSAFITAEYNFCKSDLYERYRAYSHFEMSDVCDREKNYDHHPWNHCLMTRRGINTVVIYEAKPSLLELKSILMVHAVHPDYMETIDMNCHKHRSSIVSSCWCLNLNYTSVSKLYCQPRALLAQFYRCQGISSLSDALQMLTGLKSLILENFQSGDVFPRMNLENFQHLENMHLINSQFREIDFAMLSIFSNQLKSLVLVGIPMYEISHISCSDHPIQRYDCYQCMLNLLAIEGAQISNLLNEPLLLCPNNLTKLSLTNNSLSDIPTKIFEGMTPLHFLDMSYNQVYELPNDIFRESPYIQVFNISHNNLSHVPAILFLLANH